MADHYRGLIKSLMKLGFLFKRQGERKHEIWRNRLTEQHVMFDRQAVSSSRAAVAAVLKEASKPVEKPATERAARSSRSGGRSGSRKWPRRFAGEGWQRARRHGDGDQGKSSPSTIVESPRLPSTRLP